MKTRRDVLKKGGAAVGACALGFPGIMQARAAEKLTFSTPFGFSPDFIEVMNAKSAGYFEREGLDVTVRGAQGTAQTLQQLVGGESQFVRLAQIDQMRMVSKQKQPLVCVSTLYQSSNFFIISQKNKPIEKAEDLRNKIVGVVSVNGSTDAFLDLILTKVGLPRDAVKRESTGNSPGALQFVKQGRVDCFFGTLAVIVPLERMGEKIAYWSTDRYAPMPGQGYISDRNFIQKNPKTVVSFLRAIKSSVDEILDKPLKPIFERAAKNFDIPGMQDIDATIAVTEKWQQLLLSKGRKNMLLNVPELWATGASELRDAGFIDTSDPTEFYTNEYIKRALKA